MVKKTSYLSEYLKQLQSGEGLGVGKGYLPWLNARKTKSRGVSSQTLGIKTERHHQGLSTHEDNFLYIAEFDASVIDIREQFPLLPLDLALRVAQELNIRYPVVPGTNQPIIITTDYLLTFTKESTCEYMAVSVKPPSGLKTKRDFEKQEIERVWWELLGIRWTIYLDHPEQRIIAENLKWLSQPTRNQRQFEPVLITKAIDLVSLGKTDIRCVSELLSAELLISDDVANELFRYIAWNKFIELDLSYKILETGIVHILNINDYKVEKDVKSLINQ